MNLAKKVELNRITESDYRKLKSVLSYSALKTFDTDRKKFYKEFVLGEKREDKESTSTILGSLVHCLLAGQNFDDKFHIATAIEPKGQMKELVDALFTRSLKSMVDGVQTEKFNVLFSDAVQAVKYDYEGKEIAFKGKDLEKITTMFEGTDAEIYYKELLETIGKTVVSTSLITKAEGIVEKLRGHSYTHKYVNINTDASQDIEVFNELPIMFEVDNVPYKSMIDKIIIRHDVKIIEPIDFKTTWDNEDPQRAYLKFGYYLQAALYNYALEQWAKHHNLIDYKVLPMIYIFCDTSGFADPVLLDLSANDIIKGWEGFTLRGYTYCGLKELMRDIAWHNESGNWATSWQIFRNKGRVLLDLDYDEK